jgi:protein-disulfide isomerase
MRPSARLALILMAAVGLASCEKTDDAAFGRRVRAYLLSHPEVMQEVAQRLEARQAAAEATDQRKSVALLPGLRSAIERDPRDFVADPLGTVTVTEFYDYRCPHCAEAAPRVIALIRANPDVRFVFKEMPIFGATSEHAARVALAVRTAHGDSLGLYQAFMTARPLDDAAIDRIALQKGARPADLSPSAASAANTQIAQTTALFTKLSLGGTPAFIIGDTIILGADMPAVDIAIARERAKAKGA